MPSMQVYRGPLNSGEYRYGLYGTVLAVAAALLSGLFGGMFGYYTAWILTFYRPGDSERNLLLLAALLALPVVVILVTLRKAETTRLGLSWFLVAAASAYLWTSSTFDTDVRLLTDTEEFGVFVVDNPERVDAVTSAHLTIDGDRTVLDIEAAEDSEALVLVVAPTPPDGCAEFGSLGGSPAYACSAPTSLQFPDTVSYSWSGAALEAGGVSIATKKSTDLIDDLPVVAVPVDVTFETYTSDDQRIFNRPLLGVAAVDQYAITYLAEAQTPADDHWTAVVEYRFPRGIALLSIARDLSLILLGGAVSIFLIPRVLNTRRSVPVAKALPSLGSGPTQSSASSAKPERDRVGSSRRVPLPVFLGSLVVAAALVALRRRRGSNRNPD